MTSLFKLVKFGFFEFEMGLFVEINLVGIVSLKLITLGGIELHKTFAKFENIFPLSYGLVIPSLFLLFEKDSLIYSNLI